MAQPNPSTSDEPIKFRINQDYYLCEECGTHVALHAKLLKEYTHPDNNKHYLLFESQSLRNVVADCYNFITNKKTTVISIYCVTCFADLGFRFISLAEPKDEIREGRFMLFANMLMLWKGKKVEEELGVSVPEELIAPKLIDRKQIEQILGITERLKLLFGETEGHVKKKFLDGVTDEPAEKNMPEAVTNEPVGKTMHEAVTEDPVEQS